MELLKPQEVDLLLRYPFGRTLRLAKAKQIPCIRLPDGEIRFDKDEIEKLLKEGKITQTKSIQSSASPG